MPPLRRLQPAKPSKPAAKRAAPLNSSRSQALADTAEQFAQLQRQYGNRAVQRLIQSTQAEKTQRAAAAATAPIQRAAAPAEGEAQTAASAERAGEGFEAGAEFEAGLSAARGGGAPLPNSTQAYMAQRMGADFSGVKVHTDAQSDQLNRSIQAKAFTTGQDVFFRAGAYDPASRDGQTLLAHELTHVVQQTGGAVQRSAAVVQRTFEFVPAGTGNFEKDEQTSFDALLAANNFDPLTFTAGDYATLQTSYGQLAKLVANVAKHTAAKKRESREKLADAYKKLGADLQLKVLADGKPTWDAAVGLAVQQYNALPAIEQVPTNEHFKKISTPMWPTVGGRGAMPDSFWKSVKKNIRTAHGAAAAGAGAFSAECDKIYADMGTQFTAWDGTLTNRGAWWGSPAPGSKAGAKDVPSTVILELQRKATGNGWNFSNSFSGGLSFHKTRGAVDFIYHMQSAST